MRFVSSVIVSATLLGSLPVLAGGLGRPADPAVAPAQSAGQTALPLAVIKAFVTPVYPELALKAGQTAEVDLVIRISPTGNVETIESVGVTPPVAGFEQAVRAVIDQWSFRREVDAQCEVRPYSAMVKVWFDLREGKPVVSYGRTSEPLKAPASASALDNLPALRGRAMERYPAWARMKQVEADVAVALDFSGDTGEPVKIRATTADLLDGHVSTQMEAMFRAASEDVMSRAQLKLDPAAAGKTIRHCTIFSFRLQ